MTIEDEVKEVKQLLGDMSEKGFHYGHIVIGQKLDNILKYNKECRYCGDIFVQTPGMNMNNKYCSSVCKSRHINSKKQILKRLYKYEEKTRKDTPLHIIEENVREKFDESVTLPKIYKSSNGRCHYCGVVCVMDDDINNERYANIEHKTPIAKGGWHSYENIVLSCKKCNTKKGIIDYYEFRKNKSTFPHGY